MFISILGRQPEISLAELEAVFGKENVRQLSPQTAAIDAPDFDLSILGGSTKAGRVVFEHPLGQLNGLKAYIDVSRKIAHDYQKKWRSADRKITLGISSYNFRITPRDVQKTGLLLKSSLKKDGVSLRLIPNSDLALSTATSFNNKLGQSEAKVELMVIKSNSSIIVAESIGAQNITAYAKRDQQRPKRDAFVGMLPPKLAQIMLNLAAPTTSRQLTILDPFCGTGTVLQEALLRGFDVVGSDLSDKMIDYTQQNLTWLASTHHADGSVIDIRQADATNHTWNSAKTISAVACETYLGQPFSAPPSPPKLKEVVGNCNHIISQFLTNIHPQLSPNTPLCLAVPAWLSTDGSLTHLPLIRKLSHLGYELTRPPLVYARPDQVVARELLVLRRTPIA